MDVFLCGQKGLNAARILIRRPEIIEHVSIARDPGLIEDPFDEIVKIFEFHGIEVNPAVTYKSESSIAIAVGWKKFISRKYSKLFVIHDSLLPKYRGWNPLVTALQAGDKIAGVTLILGDDMMDHGPIIAQKIINLVYPIKLATAMEMVGLAIEELLEEFLKSSPKFDLSHKPQDEQFASYSLWRDEADYRIDWDNSAEFICRFIDSVSTPYKGASTEMDGCKFRVLDALEVELKAEIVNTTPGKIFRLEDGLPVVVCRSGLIKLLDVRDSIDFDKKVYFSFVRKRFD